MPRPVEPLAQIPWDEIESELGHGTSVVLKCVIGVVVRWLVRPAMAHKGGLSDTEARSADIARSGGFDRGIGKIGEADVA